MYVCYEDIRSSGLELHTDSCELPHELWEMNPGPLEKQPGLVTTESSCQSVFLQKRIIPRTGPHVTVVKMNEMEIQNSDKHVRSKHIPAL